jgi:RNA polymerase sigma factor (sigma-70 family)
MREAETALLRRLEWTSGMDRPRDSSGGKDDLLKRHLEFEELWAANRKAALARVRRLLGDGLRRRVDSADILQDVLLIASRKFLSGEVPEMMSSQGFLRWINRISNNAVKTLVRFHVAARRRSIHREERLTSGARASLAAGSDASPSGILSRRELGERVERALLKLSPTERRVVELVHLNRWKVSEAAANLKKTSNSTSVLLCNALKKLRRFLEEDGSPEDEGQS